MLWKLQIQLLEWVLLQSTVTSTLKRKIDYLFLNQLVIVIFVSKCKKLE